MASKVKKYSDHERVYSNNIWQDYTGATWTKLSAAYYPDNTAAYNYPQGKKSSTKYRPKSLFFNFSRSYSTSLQLSKAVVVVHMTKNTDNEYPSLKAFVGNGNAPYKKSPVCSVAKPYSIQKSDTAGYVHIYYKLSDLKLSDFKNLIIEFDWSRTKTNSQSLVKVGWMGINVYTDTASKITIGSNLSSEEIYFGETIDWTLTTKQTGSKGTMKYKINHPKGCKIIDTTVSGGSYSNNIWTVTLNKNQSAKLSFKYEPTSIGLYDMSVDDASKSQNYIKSGFSVVEVPVSDYGVTIIPQSDIYAKEKAYVEVFIKGNAVESSLECYDVSAIVNGKEILDDPISRTSEVIFDEHTYNIANTLNGCVCLELQCLCLDVQEEGDYGIHLKIPIRSWVSGQGVFSVDDTSKDFVVLDAITTQLNIVPSRNSNDYCITSINVGEISNWTIRAKANKHNFFQLTDKEFDIVIEEPPAYIGCVRLSRGHSADVTASVSNTLIDDRYRNRVYMGKKGDYTEDISMKLRIPPEDVETLKGLVEFDKPVPIDTIPVMADGNPLNHRGWAELYKINNIKKINERLYDCEPVVSYLTHEINTEFTAIRDTKVYNSTETTQDKYPYINTYLEKTHKYSDILTTFLTPSPLAFYTDAITEDGYAGAYEIPPNNSIIFTSEPLQPYGNYSIKFRNTLPSLYSEDYDNNWKMAIRLKDTETNATLFEHMYHNFQHFDNNEEVANVCKVTDTFANGETNNYTNMYLTKDNFMPEIDSNKGIVSITMDGIKPFDENNVYPNPVEYSDYKADPSVYDDYDVVKVINVPIGVDIYHIPSTDPVGTGTYSVERYLGRTEITNHNNKTVTFNLSVKNSVNYVANKRVRITVTDDLDYTESWTKMTDINGNVSIDLNCDSNLYTCYIEFAETSEYRGVEATFFINVNWTGYTDTQFIYDAPERFVTVDATYPVTLKNSNGNALANKDIYYAFSDFNMYHFASEGKLTTNSNGKVEIPIQYNDGTQYLKIQFKGDNTYNPCVITEMIVIDLPYPNYSIEADDVLLDIYDTNHTYSGMVTYNNSPVVNQDVIVKFYSDNNLITKTTTTNENGVFSIDANLSYGLWYVDMIIESSENNATSYITRTIEVSYENNERKNTKFEYNVEHNLDLNSTFPAGLFTTRLLDSNNNPIPFLNVNFEVLNEDLNVEMEFTARTDSNGVATLPWYSEEKEVSVNFRFDKNNQYNEANGTARIHPATTTATSNATWSYVRAKNVIVREISTDPTIAEVHDTGIILSRVAKGTSYLTNVQAIIIIERNDRVDKVAYSKSKKISDYAISATVGKKLSTVVYDCTGAILLPSMRNGEYTVTIIYKDPSKAIKGGVVQWTINQRPYGGEGDDGTVSSYSLDSADGDTISYVTIQLPTSSGVDLNNRLFSVWQNTGFSDVWKSYGVSSQNKLTVPLMKSKIIDGGLYLSSPNIDLSSGMYLTEVKPHSKTVPTINISNWWDSRAIQNPIITTNPNQVYSYEIQLIHEDSCVQQKTRIYSNDSGVTQPKLILNQSGAWHITILFDDVAPNCSQDIWTGTVNGGELTSLYENSLPTEDGYVVVDPSNNLGETFGSDVTFQLRNGSLNMVDYGMIHDKNVMTGGKIFVDDYDLAPHSVYLETEIYYDNVFNQRLNNLEGLLQIESHESLQESGEEYQTIVCSPSPVPDNTCKFTRHTAEGTMYFYDGDYLDDEKSVFGVKYIGCPFNQYKGGTDLKSSTNISIFNLDGTGYSPVFLDNGLVKVGFHRYSGYVEVHRYDEISKDYQFINAFKIKDNPKLHLKNNGYSDDFITIEFGATEWTMWRGKPYIEVKHPNTDIRILNLYDTVTCETSENSAMMELISPYDVYMSNFSPFTSLQKFKKELHIGEDVKVDNFSVRGSDLDEESESYVEVHTDSIFTKEPAIVLYQKEDCSVAFPSNGELVHKPSSTFSLLVDNLYGSLPQSVTCMGYATSVERDPVYQNKVIISPQYVETKNGVMRYKFKSSWLNVPREVEYVNFIITFKNGTKTTFNKMMLYNGTNDEEYSKDDSLERATKTEVSFNDTCCYAKLSNEKDEFGLGIVRPHKKSINLRHITESPITLLIPYMKQCRPMDTVEKLIIEYVNSYNQVVSIENIGGHL